MYKGIVLDEMQKKAFLLMAAQEGVICEKEMTRAGRVLFLRHPPREIHLSL